MASVVNLSIEKELALFNGTLKLVRCGSQKQVTTGTTEIYKSVVTVVNLKKLKEMANSAGKVWVSKTGDHWDHGNFTSVWSMWSI